MSVLIKGMDMPEGEGWYKLCLRVNPDGSANIAPDDGSEPITPYDVVEIPTPHGRLIDADEFIELVQTNDCDKCDDLGGSRCELCGINDLISYLDKVPTIIEAEVSE